MDVGETPAEARQARTSEQVIQIAIRLVLLAGLIYWSFVLLSPFIPILLWSVVLAVALYPAYDWLTVHLGDRPRIAALLITLAVLAVFLGPAAWLGIGLVEGLRSITDSTDVGRSHHPDAARQRQELAGHRRDLARILANGLRQSGVRLSRARALLEAAGWSRPCDRRQRGDRHADVSCRPSSSPASFIPTGRHWPQQVGAR